MDYSLDYFSRHSHFSQKEELFINKYINRPLANRNLKFEAIGAMTYLQMILFSDIETGFYYDVSGNRFQLLASKMGITNKSLTQILNWCFEYSLLDEAMFKKYNILTSLKMQDDYAHAEPQRRKQNINMDYVYKGCSFTYKYEIALQKWKNAEQKSKNAKQKSGDKTRLDETNIQKRDNNLSTEAFLSSLENFKKTFPNKACDDEITYRPGIDFELLTKSIHESAFLENIHKPFNWKWLIDNYSKVVSGQYKDFPNKDKKDNKALTNFTGREYSPEFLNSLYDDLGETCKELDKQKEILK